MMIGSHDTDDRVLVIAEIGNNHEGDFELAERMIGLAAEAGADAVKFQTIVPEELVSAQETDRIAQLEKFRLSYDQYAKLANRARREGVMFLSTPFDLESARFLSQIVPAFKIASGDNNFFPLIEAVAETGKPVIISSGMSTLADIQEAIDLVLKVWTRTHQISEMAVLHCVSNYPTQPGEANLRAIRGIEDLGVTPGYSDHTLGIEAAVLSVALGARIVEKHFTVDHNYSDFRDHKLSADPKGFREMVLRIRDAEVYLGDGKKRILESEKEIAQKARRSIVAKVDLEAGRTIQFEDLAWNRPAGGLAPGNEDMLIGKKLTKAIKKGSPVLEQYLSNL